MVFHSKGNSKPVTSAEIRKHRSSSFLLTLPDQSKIPDSSFKAKATKDLVGERPVIKRPVKGPPRPVSTWNRRPSYGFHHKQHSRKRPAYRPIDSLSSIPESEREDDETTTASSCHKADGKKRDFKEIIGMISHMARTGTTNSKAEKSIDLENPLTSEPLVAQIVQDDIIMEATVTSLVDEEGEMKKYERSRERFILRMILASILCVIILVGVTVHITLKLFGGRMNFEPSVKPSTIPSSVPTSSPSQSHFLKVSQALASIHIYAPMHPTSSVNVSNSVNNVGSNDTVTQLEKIDLLDTKSLDSESSPQYKAVDWLSSTLSPSFTISSPNLAQRYILAVLYFSLDGDNWKQCYREDIVCKDNKVPYLSPEHECEWYGNNCINEDEIITQIFLSK